MGKKVAKWNKDSTMQRIRAFHLGYEKVELTKPEQKQLDRMSFLFMVRHDKKYSKRQAIDKLINKYGVGQATAYRDYNNMTQLFGEMEEVDRRMEMVFLRENYFWLYRKLVGQMDWEAAGKMLERYEKTLPPEKKDEDYLELDYKEYKIKLPREVSKLLKQQVRQSPVIDLNNLDTEEISYKEVNDAEEEE